jgi:hypothetical protein
MDKITLSPVSRKGGLLFPGSYKDKASGKENYMIALSSGHYRIVTNLSSNDVVFKHNFVGGRSLDIMLDLTTEDGQQVMRFLKSHPLCFAQGVTNANSTNPLVEVVYKSEKINANFSDLMEKLEIVSDVLRMEVDKKLDLCWSLGINPTGMSEKEMILELLGSNLEGKAVLDRGNVIAYGRMTEKEKQAAVYASKAIRYGLATYEHGVYMIAGQNGGSSEKTLANLLLGNEELYRNYVAQEVDKIDKENRVKIKTLDASDLSQAALELLPATSGSKKAASKKAEAEN